MTASKSFPPRCASPPVANTSHAPPPTSRMATSKVPPPRSNTITVCSCTGQEPTVQTSVKHQSNI
eukprot:7731168-Pyramimonas_sp.AAC.1